MHMTGFSIADRLPRNFDVETKPVLDACEDVVRELAGLCASVVDGAPEELSADLNDAGAVLTGAPAAYNTFDAPETVAPRALATTVTGDGFTAVLPPCSVAAFTVTPA